MVESAFDWAWGLGSALRGWTADRRAASMRSSAEVGPAPAGRTALPRDASGSAPRRGATAGEALALRNVWHSYGRLTVVCGVSLEVAAGEVLCLVGPSGCGKSTLLRVAAGLEPLQRGEVHIGGHIVADAQGGLPPERRHVGLFFQDYALFPHLSVLDNVCFGLTDLSASEQRTRALATLCQVGMANYADAFPHVLSGGQQQRVALARALAPEPAVLLLDEPFSGLDTRLREQVRDETFHMLKRNGVATMLVTQDPEEAMFLADRIALMRNGRLVQVGTPVDLYTRPIDVYAALFFSEADRLRSTVRDGVAPTPVGPVPTDLPDGTAVEVLIRPEALHLAELGKAASTATWVPVLARVDEARLLGRTSLVHLSVPNGRGGTVHLHARIPGQFLPPPESYVCMTLDLHQAFVCRYSGSRSSGLVLDHRRFRIRLAATGARLRLALRLLLAA